MQKAADEKKMHLYSLSTLEGGQANHFGNFKRIIKKKFKRTQWKGDNEKIVESKMWPFKQVIEKFSFNHLPNALL